MSGEYYCIEEVTDTKGCYDEYDESDIKQIDSTRRFNNVRDDAQSTTSKKSHDFRLHEIEEQLELAENKCNTLKFQLESMKQIYHGSNSPASSRSPQGRTPSSQAQVPSRQRKSGTADGSKYNRKRTVSSMRRTQKQNPDLCESNLTVPQKSSTSSGCVQTHTPYVQAKGVFMAPLVRQNSLSIGTDHSGAAVRTINNILTGITQSVNRLTKFHPETKNDQTNVKHPHQDAVTAETNLYYGEHHPDTGQQIKPTSKNNQENDTCSHVLGIRDVVLDKLNNNAVKPKGRWSRHTSAKSPIKVQAVPNVNKQIKSTLKQQVDNAPKVGFTKPQTVAENESQSVLLPRKRKRPAKRLNRASKGSLHHKISETLNEQIEQLTSSNLVELYHNIAAKSSDSDSALCSKSAIRQKGGGDLPVPSIKLPTVASVSANITEMADKQPLCKQLTTIKENCYSGIERVVNNNCNVNIIKNYELPTIASRMKQVNKQFLSSFSFRSIPFCPVKSITPSHNIGLNIQQVMNILKTRQPITGISPTLAHNIGLAAGKLESQHLSTLVSTLSSRLGFGRLQCPLIKSPIANNAIQNMERAIPEEVETAADEFNDNLNTNGPFGDRQESPACVWSIDPEKDKRCTCAPPKGVPLQQLLRKYQGASDVASIHTRLPNKNTYVTAVKPVRSAKGFTPRKQRIRNWIRNDVQRVTTENARAGTDFAGKEKNLKMVLKNLHDEFESLNTKYENLAKNVTNSNDANESTTKELEVMEEELNKKEEEINMVMSLYKEVIALKDQVKKLRAKTSQPSIANFPHGINTEFKEPQTAQHLTQLLKQIQNYQLHCKNKA